MSTVQLSANPILHARTKHVELDLYFVREKVVQGALFVKHVPSVDQVADVLTKAISSSKFKTLRDKLRVRSLPTLSLRGDVRGVTALPYTIKKKMKPALLMWKLLMWKLMVVQL